MPVAQKPRLKLYHAAPSRSSITLWMLEELGEPYAIELIDLKKGEQLKPEYLAINPMGKVPALDDGGIIVTEGAAICCYLADAFPKAGLAPPIGDRDRGPYLKWLFFGPSCLEPAIVDRAQNRTAPRAMVGWANFDTVLGVLRDGVAKGPYLLGDRFSAADVVIGAGLRWGMLFKLLPELPEFVAYTKRLAQRPALQRQIAKDEAFARNSGG